MLTDQQRNGMIDPAYRWPNGEVPFVIDNVFSEYYDTKLQSSMRGVEGNIHALCLPLKSSTPWWFSGRSNGDSYLSFPQERITHTHICTCQASHVYVTKASCIYKVKCLDII